MDPIDIDRLADPSLEEPVLVEGLPGVGHVGKLVVEHLLEEFDSEVVRRVHADDFPPQVSIDDEGVAHLASAEFHAVTVEDEDGDETDLLVLTGNHQAGSNEGHYRLTDAFLDVADGFGVGRVFALGGVPTGELVDEPSVLGAVSEPGLRDTLEEAGVEFRPDEPAGGIVGVSGLLLGLGGRRGYEVACLMGETSGYLVDPQSARVVLEVLQAVVGFDVDYESLEERAEEMQEVVGKLREMQDQQGAAPPTDDTLRYIG
jgi:hypothetical protein